MTVSEHLPNRDGQTLLDDDNAIRLYYRTDVHGPIGLLWSHRLDDGRWCTTDIPFRGHGAGRAEWSVVLDEPITITPALRCAGCKTRAWLDGGKTRAAK